MLHPKPLASRWATGGAGLGRILPAFPGGVSEMVAQERSYIALFVTMALGPPPDATRLLLPLTLGASAPLTPPGAEARERVRSGFTLVELVITLLIVGIMANFMIPLFRPERFQLDSAMIRVGSALIAQQRNAVLRQHNLVVGVDTLQRQLRVHYDADNDATIGTAEQWFVIELGEGVVFGRGGAPARPLSGRTVSMEEEQDGLPALTYRRNGSASEQAIIYLTSERASRYGDIPTDGRAIEIERATGRVSCYSYRSGTWVQSC